MVVVVVIEVGILEGVVDQLAVTWSGEGGGGAGEGGCRWPCCWVVVVVDKVSRACGSREGSPNSQRK